MKKTMLVLIIAAMIGIGAVAVFAAEHMGGGMMGGGGMMSNREDTQQGMQQGGMMGRGMMMDGMGPMMGGGSLATNEDGGVIVLMGNQLYKYDKDLNLIKQVEIKIDWQAMQKMMMQRHEMMMQNRNMMMGGQSQSK